MPSLKEILAAKAAKSTPPPAAASPPPAAVMPAPQGPPDRQLGAKNEGEHDHVLPMRWPVDPATCDGNRLTVMIDEHNEGWLGVMLEDGRFLPLLRRLGALGIPF